MSFTYDGPDAVGTFSNPRDEVRFLAQDTDESPNSVSNEDIAYLLLQEQMNVRHAAADVLDRRADKLDTLTRTTLTVGPFSTSGASASASESYRRLAERLRSSGGPGASAPMVELAAGIQPAVFGLGMHDVYRPALQQTVAQAEGLPTVVALTQAQYDALPVKNPSVLYLITD